MISALNAREHRHRAALSEICASREKQ